MTRPDLQIVRSLQISLAAIAAVGWVGPLCVGPLCAEAPVNPLRTSSAPAASFVAQQIDEEQATGQPSIVPPNLGQPELLPSPQERGDLLYGDPDLTGNDPFQQLVHPWFAEPWFSHGDPNDPLRHIGVGQPLIGTSWRNRPLYFGTFVGGVMLDDLVPNKIYQNDTTFIGARLGYDFDHFWGLEGRWAFARADLADGSGVPFSPASRNNFADLSLVFYPLGDARWRPYLAAGLGFTTFRFNNQLGQRISEAPLDIPLGFGLKYFFSPFFTLRFDFTDNLTVGNDRVSGMHNISLMAGAEFRFGGRRPSYFPWHNNTTYW